MRTAINEIANLTEAEKRYRIYERMEEMYASNEDWKNVLACKWSLLVNHGGNH